MRPGVCDCGWDHTVMGAREHRVVLPTFVSCQRLVIVLRCTLGEYARSSPSYHPPSSTACATEHFEPPPPTLESPNLHLFVRHKLQRAVAHAHQWERRAAAVVAGRVRVDPRHDISHGSHLD
jgi:hypothetical protein